MVNTKDKSIIIFGLIAGFLFVFGLMKMRHAQAQCISEKLQSRTIPEYYRQKTSEWWNRKNPSNTITPAEVTWEHVTAYLNVLDAKAALKEEHAMKEEMKAMYWATLPYVHPNVYVAYITPQIQAAAQATGAILGWSAGYAATQADNAIANLQACIPNCGISWTLTISWSGSTSESGSTTILGPVSLLPINANLVSVNGNNTLGICTGWACGWQQPTSHGGGGGGGGSCPTPSPNPSSSPTPTVSPTPSVAPGEVAITSFKISNFREQETTTGMKYYQILKEQMSVPHENYQLNLTWSVANAKSCTASCKYVKIDDYLANPNIDELPAQPYSCDTDINNEKTFAGEVEIPVGSAKTKPRETGIIRYTLSCQRGKKTDTKHLLVAIQEFKWFETIPFFSQ